MQEEKRAFVGIQDGQEKNICKFAVSSIMPKEESAKQCKKQDNIYLEFPLGESDIFPNYKGNSIEISKVTNLIKEIGGNENMEILGISIECYTAPNGSYVLNQDISTKRAYHLKKYIQLLYGFQDQLISIKGMSDDWGRLEQLIIESDINKKEELLSIIWNNDVFEGRENALRELRNGEPYQYMEQHLFPLLCRFCCSITYSVHPFDREKGKQILKISPEQLSLDGLYRIACTYKPYTPTFNEIINLAVRLYPDSAIANLNAAAVALKLENASSAEKYLQQVEEDTSEYLNNKGVLYLIRGDYTKAWLAFRQSVEKGGNDGEFNLMMMEKIKICM